MVFEPPVIWANSSSGRASASVTFTLSSGRASSSAMSIAVEVVMPWPTSMRGSAQDTEPSFSATSTMSWPSVGFWTWMRKSPRSSASAISGVPGRAWATPSSRP